MAANAPAIDPKLDLVLTRVVDVPREALWRGWTQPDLLRQWFAPRPLTTTECEIDLRPGGRFRTLMRSPEGEEYPGLGCYLELVENRRIVFTDALGPGYRPTAKPFFTAIIDFDDDPAGTKYTAVALHKDEAERRTHEEMGFHDGWGLCLDQLVELARRLPR